MEKFWTKVNKNGPVSEYRPELGPCWIWTMSCTSAGYGNFWNGKHEYAHRFSYEMAKGKIAEGFHIDHLCRVRSCCNPDHMEPVPQGVNTLRGFGASGTNIRKTHCKFGHDFSPENTITYPSKPGARNCRICERRRTEEINALEKKKRADKSALF